MYVGLASRPMPAEGRESVMTYNRANKAWIVSDWLPSVDTFLEGTAASHKELHDSQTSVRVNVKCSI